MAKKKGGPAKKGNKVMVFGKWVTKGGKKAKSKKK